MAQKPKLLTRVWILVEGTEPCCADTQLASWKLEPTLSLRNAAARPQPAAMPHLLTRIVCVNGPLVLKMGVSWSTAYPSPLPVSI
jgi:hypothetical protein